MSEGAFHFVIDSLPILFEDEDFLVLSKVAGVTTDDFTASVGASLDRQLFAFHRLDKGTSGILLLGKRHLLAAEMGQAFEKKLVRKAYLAVVHGVWDPSWNRVENRLERGLEGRMKVSSQGKNAVTTFRLLAKNDEKSWVEALPKTGRTHQIRIHCAGLGRPVLGDALYGFESQASDSLALHAYSLTFRHPKTQETVSILNLPSSWRSTYLAGLDVDSIWTQIEGRTQKK